MTTPPFEQSQLFIGIPGLVHGFFGRRGGRSTGDFASLNISENLGDAPGIVAANQTAALTAIGMETASLAQLTQIHSSHVITLESAAEATARPEADAMVTATPGVVLGIKTADCAPILLADPEAGVIGAAHAGWRGAFTGIIGATVTAMRRLGADPDRIIAAIGPTIALESYEVGPDFVSTLLKEHPSAASRVNTPTGGREHFDLPGFVFDQLVEAGIGRIDDCRRCTYMHAEQYFSHRRATHQQTKAGRQISMIGLR